MTEFNLGRTTRDFAEQLNNLLNRTVCNNVRLSAVSDPSGQAAWVGYRISKQALDPIEGIPLCISPRARATAYLAISYRLQVDSRQRYLMVTSSFVGLFMDKELERPLLHYDYERDKPDEYPEAHIQLTAASPDWAELLGDNQPLEKLHLPVGGRRFRPCLEDMVEFLAREGLTPAREGWKDEVKSGREWFQERQLKAAIRRRPELALAVLAELRSDGLLTGESSWALPQTM